MGKLSVVFLLGFLVAVSCDDVTTSVPNVVNGGILNNSQGYIHDPAYTWVDLARNYLAYVNDPRGTEAVNTWIDASIKFNIAKKVGDENEAFRLLHVCNDSFKAMAPYFSKPELTTLFLKIYEEFGAALKTNNLKVINDHIISAFTQFNEQIDYDKSGVLPLSPLNSSKK